MDIKKKVEEIVSKLQDDNKLLDKFQKDPASVIEKLVGVDLPNDLVNQLIEAVQAKIKLDKIGDVLGGLGSLFGK